MMIRREVVDKFAEVCYKNFVDKSTSFLRERHPAETSAYSGAQLTELIETGIPQARSYEVKRECDVIRFLELMVVLSPDFDDSDRFAWPGPILRSDQFSVEEKLELLFDYLAQERERSR